MVKFVTQSQHDAGLDLATQDLAVDELFDPQFLLNYWPKIQPPTLNGQSRSSSRSSSIDGKGSGTTTAQRFVHPRFSNASQSLELPQNREPYGEEPDFANADKYRLVPSQIGDTSAADGRLRCFDHGCDGRTFSSPENYRRHIREKQRPVDAICIYCMASFTRRSNRDKHVLNGKCRVGNGRQLWGEIEARGYGIFIHRDISSLV
ncbi:hypothetical protein BB8028_0002g04580 [Beauveria bassiana]|uniref:Uncharacterized protein n=1 Tax=Beauveria bassiana TaxID=176275 RepID=A0A2N6NU90_BEABA|nr:hypothetical protein BM221_003295 [Beauveria bassiana]PQK10134.1 hypothetical protein BB8028_0002g04580 [Beauveria bassiana]